MRFTAELVCAIILGVWVFATGAPMIGAALTTLVAFIMFSVFLWVWRLIPKYRSEYREWKSRSDSRSENSRSRFRS